MKTQEQLAHEALQRASDPEYAEMLKGNDLKTAMRVYGDLRHLTRVPPGDNILNHYQRIYDRFKDADTDNHLSSRQQAGAVTKREL